MMKLDHDGRGREFERLRALRLLEKAGPFGCPTATLVMINNVDKEVLGDIFERGQIEGRYDSEGIMWLRLTTDGQRAARPS